MCPSTTAAAPSRRFREVVVIDIWYQINRDHCGRCSIERSRLHHENAISMNWPPFVPSRKWMDDHWAFRDRAPSVPNRGAPEPRSSELDARSSTRQSFSTDNMIQVYKNFPLGIECRKGMVRCCRAHMQGSGYTGDAACSKVHCLRNNHNLRRLIRS
jgi:hypothetical protein